MANLLLFEQGDFGLWSHDIWLPLPLAVVSPHKAKGLVAYWGRQWGYLALAISLVCLQERCQD